MTSAIATLVALLWLQGPPPPAAQPGAAGAVGPVGDEADVRARVQAYFDTQARKDPDAALAFWSAGAPVRPTREAFVSVFGQGTDTFAVDIHSVTITGTEARVRVTASRTRLIERPGLPPFTSRMAFQNAQLWRKEAGTWKLVRDGPFAEDFADALMAATPEARAKLLSENRTELTPSLRRVLGERATLAAVAQNLARAKSIFDIVLEVARAAGDRRGESEALQNIANTYYHQREYDAAVDLYRQRLALAKEMDDGEATAASLLGLATVAYARAEYTPALTLYREALDIYEARAEGTSIGRTLVSVGNVQYLQAEYDAASASYRRALTLLVEGMDTQGASFARGGLARVFAAQGDIAGALDMYGQVLIDARQRATDDARLKNGVAVTLESIGELYFRLANTDRARSHFEEARQLVDADPELSARMFGRLGLTELVAGRFDAALAAYTESRTRYETARNPEGVAAAWVGTGFTQTAREKFTDAMSAYRTAIRMFESQRHNEESARAWLGLSLAQSGAAEHANALESAQKVRVIAAGIENDDLTWRSAVRAGEVLRKLKRPEDARRSFDEAIRVIERIAEGLPTTPDARGQLDDSASAWTGLAFTLASLSDPAGALAAVEGRRAHMRRVHLAAFQRDITRGATPEEQTEEQEIVRELISTRAQLRVQRNARRPDAERLARLQDQLKTLVGRRGDQQSRLYARVPDLQQWRGLTPPAAAADIGALIPGPRGLVLEYLVSDEETLVLTIAHGDASPDIAAAIVPLNRRTLAEAVDEAMRPDVLADAAEWTRKATPLVKALIEPVAMRLADRDRIVIVPDDLLWKVPFEALPLGAADIASAARVSYATSLATLAVQRAILEPAAASAIETDREPASGAATAAAPALRIGLVAAPAIPSAVRAQIALTQPSWKEPDPAAARALAESLAKPFQDAAALRAGAEASETAARGLIEASDVVLLSAPLQVSAPAPLFTSVLLGGDEAGDSQNDGRWEAREWFDAKARARALIVPDGSSLGAAGVGSAMDAVAWAAAAAGVPSLVIGRWPAEAFVSDVLLTAFHEALAAGKTPADAWTDAVRAARNDTPRTPAAWAGLRLVGAW